MVVTRFIGSVLDPTRQRMYEKLSRTILRSLWTVCLLLLLLCCGAASLDFSGCFAQVKFVVLFACGRNFSQRKSVLLSVF